MSLPTRNEAERLLQEFGMNVSNIELDTNSFRKVRYEGKGKKNKDAFYIAFSIPGTDLVSGIYGTYWPYYVINKFIGVGTFEHVDPAEMFRINKLIEAAQAKVEETEPDLMDYHKAEELTEHPYLTKKNVKAGEGFRKAGSEMLIPYHDFNDKLVGVQRIFKDGTKRMIKSSKMKGAFHLIKGSDCLAICEGYATGATIHEATGWSVYCCFAASNLKNIARKLKTKRVIMCADQDSETEKKTGENPGIKYGKEVADMLFCPLVYPKVNGDFNDIGVQESIKLLLHREPKSLFEQLKVLDDTPQREEYLMVRNTSIGTLHLLKRM